MKNNKIIRSPFQFSGNKKKAISNGLIDLLKQSGKPNLADMMCGSAVVGLNWDGDVILNDTQVELCAAHLYLRSYRRQANWDELIRHNIAEFELEYDFTSENDYYLMREKYNQKNNRNNPLLLMILIQISFNSLMRFNSKGHYNVPFGHNKKPFNSTRILEALEHYRKIRYIYNQSIFDFSYDSLENHILYFDPPYYQTQYSYGGWSEQDEEKFWELIIWLSETHKIAVSNVLRYRGRANKILIDKCVKNGFLVNVIGNVTYNNWQKAVSTVEHDTKTTEVLITNFVGTELPPF